MSETFGKLDSMHSIIEENQGPRSSHFRLMKVGEEYGEAIDKYLILEGVSLPQNQDPSANEVAQKLCDVAIAALVALHDWVDWEKTSPEKFLRDRLDQVYLRTHIYGS